MQALAKDQFNNDIVAHFGDTSDHSGSVRKVIDISTINNTKVVQEITYDTWGKPTFSYPDNNEDLYSKLHPFGFAGGIYDVDTGLYRFGARDYDPYTGRWTAKDPIRFNGGTTNLYGYCSNDPVNFVDPEGLKDYAAVWIWEKSTMSWGSFMGHVSLQINNHMYDYGKGTGARTYKMSDYMKRQKRNGKRIKLNLTDEQIGLLGGYFLFFGSFKYGLFSHSCVDSVRMPLAQVLKDTTGQVPEELDSDTWIPAYFPVALIDAGVSDPKIGVFKGKQGNAEGFFGRYIPILGPALESWAGSSL